MSQASRMRREKRTVRAMARMYCAHNHGHARGLCPECAKLVEYSEQKVDKCVFRRSKPTCVKCRIHCYEPARREQMRTVMRYAGPRMMTRHPVMTIFHVVDGLRRPKR